MALSIPTGERSDDQWYTYQWGNFTGRWNQVDSTSDEVIARSMFLTRVQQHPGVPLLMMHGDEVVAARGATL